MRAADNQDNEKDKRADVRDFKPHTLWLRNELYRNTTYLRSKNKLHLATIKEAPTNHEHGILICFTTGKQFNHQQDSERPPF